VYSGWHESIKTEFFVCLLAAAAIDRLEAALYCVVALLKPGFFKKPGFSTRVQQYCGFADA